MRHVLVVVLLLGSRLVLAAGGEQTTANKEVKLGEGEKKLLVLLNEARKKEKLAPLTVNAVLCKIARLHSENMAKQEKMAHQLDGKGVGDRTEAGGYDYRVVRENLALAEGDADSPAPTPKEIHTKWMESKGHRANILHARVTEIGLAIVVSKKGTYFYTEVFASPRK